MNKQELLSALITFVIGFFAGGFLYLNTFTEIVSPDDVETKEAQEQFTVISQAYGSCGEVCPAFQVSHDGSYRYQFVPAVGQDPVIRNGTLPLKVQSDLKKSLTEKELDSQTEPQATTNCASQTGGIDIMYDVTLRGQSFVLDSCKTAVDDSSDAWVALGGVWNYLRTIK